MVLLYGSLQLGLLYGLLALGIYITFRILNIPDLTAEGSFTFGLSVSAAMTLQGHPILGILLAILAGALAGFITGIFQTKLMIHPILAGILTMSGLYSINLMVLGNSPNCSLIGVDTLFRIGFQSFPGLSKDQVKLLIGLFFVVLVVSILALFFKTQIGLSIRATGDNEDMVKASSINIHLTKILALAISNGCIALSGALISQYQGFADLNSGVGILVVGLASVIIGEVICGKRSVTIGFVSAITGSIIYRFIIALATKSNLFPAYMLKLLSACIVAIALSLPAIKYYYAIYKLKKEARQYVGTKERN